MSAQPPATAPQTPPGTSGAGPLVQVVMPANDARLLAEEAARRATRWGTRLRKAAGPHRLECAAYARQWARIARTLQPYLPPAPERHQGVQDGRGAIGVVWGVGVVALAIWGAQEAARLGGWLRLGVVVLTFVGVAASVALVEAARRRKRAQVWDDPSFGGPWSLVDKRHPTQADYEAWRRRPFRGG